MNKVYYKSEHDCANAGHPKEKLSFHMNRLSQRLEGYDNYMRDTKGFSDNTRRIYLSDVSTYGQYLYEESQNLES